MERKKLILLSGAFLVLFLSTYLFQYDKHPQVNTQFPTLTKKKPGTKVNLCCQKTSLESCIEWIPLCHYEKQSFTFKLGTDILGRDYASRLSRALRTSLFIGSFSMILSLILGTFMGIFIAYLPRKLEDFTMAVLNAFWSIPSIFIAMILTLVLPKGLITIIIAVAASIWIEAARIVRSKVHSLQEEEYVKNALLQNRSLISILRHELIPQLSTPLAVIAINNFAISILMESGLSFLGLGIPLPSPSLGNLLKENYVALFTTQKYLIILPLTILIILIFALNMFQNKMRNI